MRAKNGHPEPYHIRYWNIGNEPWGTFQIGYTDLKYFVIKNNDFAREMREADPTITLIGSAKMMEPMWLKGEDRAKYVDNVEPMFGSDTDWTGGLLEKSWGTFDGIAQHWYEGPDRHFDIAKAKTLPPDAPDTGANVTYEPTSLEYARHAGDVIRRHAEEWQGYQKRFPKMVDKKIFLSMDEYAYINLGGGGGGGFSGPTLKTALAYGMLLNEILRHTDVITMGAHTMGTSSLDISPTASAINALGVVYELYGEHLPGTIPIAVSGNSPQPTTNPNYGDEPKIRSGSPTYPLDVLATLTPDHRYLNLIIVNATEKDHKFDLNVTGSKLENFGTLWKLTAKSLDAINRAGQPAQVEVEESPAGLVDNAITVSPISVNVYRVPIGR
jgi:alpha-N-arabinofuranosidase